MRWLSHGPVNKTTESHSPWSTTWARKTNTFHGSQPWTVCVQSIECLSDRRFMESSKLTFNIFSSRFTRKLGAWVNLKHRVDWTQLSAKQWFAAGLVALALATALKSLLNTFHVGWWRLSQITSTRESDELSYPRSLLTFLFPQNSFKPSSSHLLHSNSIWQRERMDVLMEAIRQLKCWSWEIDDYFGSFLFSRAVGVESISRLVVELHAGPKARCNDCVQRCGAWRNWIPSR